MIANLRVEYAFNQAKNELGWAELRVTDYKQIENWWEIALECLLDGKLASSNQGNHSSS